MKPLLFALTAVFILQACDTADPEPVIVENPEIRFVPDSSYTVLPSGLKYYDLVEGDTTRARADDGDPVLVDYHGWLENGTLFDSSVLTQPVQFILGDANIIDGWNEGIPGMFLGGERQLVIPPELAYGEDGDGPVPGNTTIIFEVFLLGTQ